MPKPSKKPVALYLRVSMSEQTTRNQRRQLEAVEVENYIDRLRIDEKI